MKLLSAFSPNSPAALLQRLNQNVKLYSKNYDGKYITSACNCAVSFVEKTSDKTLNKTVFNSLRKSLESLKNVDNLERDFEHPLPYWETLRKIYVNACFLRIDDNLLAVGDNVIEAFIKEGVKPEELNKFSPEILEVTAPERIRSIVNNIKKSNNPNKCYNKINKIAVKIINSVDCCDLITNIDIGVNPDFINKLNPKVLNNVEPLKIKGFMKSGMDVEIINKIEPDILSDANLDKLWTILLTKKEGLDEFISKINQLNSYVVSGVDIDKLIVLPVDKLKRVPFYKLRDLPVEKLATLGTPTLTDLDNEKLDILPLKTLTDIPFGLLRELTLKTLIDLDNITPSQLESLTSLDSDELINISRLKVAELVNLDLGKLDNLSDLPKQTLEDLKVLDVSEC